MSGSIPLKPGAAEAVRGRSGATGWWGTVAAITALGSMLSTLVFVYFYLGASAEAWPPPELGPPPLGRALAATVVLLASGGTAMLAHLFATRGRRSPLLQLALAGTALLGVGFLALQALDYAASDVRAHASAYGSSVVALAGFHDLVALAGVVALLVVAVHLERPAVRPRERLMAVNVALVWYYVVSGWLAVFATIYVAPRVW